MPKVLTRLRIDEVSAVDKGAGEGVKIVLMKRDEEPYWKREFSQEQRDDAAKSGAAMKDGSFPIKNKSDLHNAMQAVGRAKNPSAVKAHIRRRASALGLTGELSDAFKKGSPMGFFQKFFARTAPADIHKSVAALAESVKSIVEDDEADKSKMLGETFDQFAEHLKSVAGASPAEHRKDDIMSPELKKALGLADDASDADALKAIATLKAKKEDKKDEEAEEEDEEEEKGERKEKRGKKEEERDEEDEEDDEEEKERKKRAAETAKLPTHVQKTLKEHEALKAQVAKLLADSELMTIRKTATEALMPEASIPTLQKAYRGDRKAIDELVGMIKTANSALQASDLLKEIGASGRGGGTTALDELNAKATELRKSQPKLTKEQAFAKVYTDPENATLVARERHENAPRVE